MSQITNPRGSLKNLIISKKKKNLLLSTQLNVLAYKFDSKSINSNIKTHNYLFWWTQMRCVVHVRPLKFDEIQDEKVSIFRIKNWTRT